ncbi:MAG: glycosyltransferase family protein [Candidatus Acidiferrales bacterium]
MRDAIVFSTWDWKTFNVPERIALSLALGGFRVLYCEMPVSQFRRHGAPLREVSAGVHAFGPEYLGAKLGGVPALGAWQWKLVARQIQRQAESLGMSKPLFLYSHVAGLAPLCREMRARGSRLIHICMDYPESYQYELIALSDRTLVIPKTVFQKLRARYGEKIYSIPQSVHFPSTQPNQGALPTLAAELAGVPRPWLGYLGPIYARLNLPLLRRVLEARSYWHFVCFGDSSALRLPNVHSVPWRPPDELTSFVASFDAGVMPYDCFDEKNLHCVPLKLFEYFAAGLPVVSTPVISLGEFPNLIYFGETATEFTAAIERALAEPPDSPKRRQRAEVARAHSTEALGRRLEEVLDFNGK